ncbi:MAG: hypothetical protein R3B06_15615 [Kofleriaceae bacterium]
MTRTFVTSTLAALVTTFAVGCVDAPATTEGEAFVFGLSADEVLAAKAVAQTEMSDAAWLDAHRGDFACANYRDLCGMIGTDAAAEVIEAGYRLAIDGADRAEIVAAQDAAIAAAPRIESSALFNSNTGNFTGGSGNKRLHITANAVQLWPSLDMRSSGDCVYQKNSFGWLASKADSITGDLRGTFTSGATVTVLTDAGSVFNDSKLDLGPRTLAADALTTRIHCSATDGTWSASGTVTVTR